MKTEQEQIEKMARIMCGYCSTDGKCAVSKNLREPDVCANVDTEHCLYKEYAERLFENGCYGNVSEYKAEIERLKAEYEKLQTNEEILASCVRDLNHENYELTQKLAKQTRIARDANAKCTGAERYLRPFQYKADRLETKCNDLKRLSDWQREEIKRLKAEVNKGCDNCETIKQGQIDVLNELKTRHDYAIKYMCYPWDISQQIDELIAEVENASSKGTY